MTIRNDGPPKEERLYGDDIAKARFEKLEARMQALEAKQAPEVKAESEAVDTSWPQVGDIHHSVNSQGKLASPRWDNDHFDQARAARGNVFRTKEEAEKADQLLLAMNELKVMAEQYWLLCGQARDHTPSRAKFSCSYDCLSLVWLTNYHINATVPGVVYFPTEASSIKAYEAVDAKYPGVLR